MKKPIIILLLFYCAIVEMLDFKSRFVKLGETVEINIGTKIKTLKRAVGEKRYSAVHRKANAQFWHFEGRYKGFFVDRNGIKIRGIDNSNYSGNADGVLTIKNVTYADQGTYEDGGYKMWYSEPEKNKYLILNKKPRHVLSLNVGSNVSYSPTAW